MTEIALLERMAKGITDTIVTNETENFTAPILNGMVSAACDMRFKIATLMLDSVEPGNRPRKLFEDVSLDDVGRDFVAFWSDQITTSWSRPPLLVSPARAVGWRNQPEYAAFTSRWLEDNDAGMQRKEVRSKLGDDYHLAVIHPFFPEWFVFTRGPNGLSPADRVYMLRTVSAMSDEFMLPDNRLDDEEVHSLYFVFIRDILTAMQKEAANNEMTGRAVMVCIGLYELCGIKLDEDNVFDLPVYYKEFAILYSNTLYETSFIPQLRKAAMELA